MASSNTSSNNTDHPTDTTNLQECLFEKDVYDVYCLIPAIAIIAILAFLHKRVRIKPNVCDGRPGLILPINFLGDSTSNRLSIAVAFGVIATDCIDLFKEVSQIETPSISVVQLRGTGPWVKAMSSVVLVLLYGAINFPIFACLMTEHLLVGAVLGLLYTLMKFVALFVLIESCPGPYTQEVQDGELNQAYKESELYGSIPSLLCYIFLIVRFLVLLINDTKWKKKSAVEEVDSSFIVAKEHNMIHVHQLLGNKTKSKSQRPEPKNWFVKLRHKIYKPRPDFKFSTGIFSTLTVIVIFIYRFTVELVLITAQVTEIIIKQRKEMKEPLVDKDSFIYVLKYYFLEVSDIIIGSFYFSLFFTSIFSILMMLHFMKCHRSHVLLSYKARDFLGNSPSRLVGRSLSYPGYQIAYVGWGYIILFSILMIVSFILGLIIKYSDWETLADIIRSALPVVVVPVCVWIFQYLLGKLVFRDRRFPDITIIVNNHRLYCVISFFFFFFNILVGFFSSIFRILKSMFLGVLFLSRIDRTPLMIGFHQWDQGYMSYFGFLNVLKSFSHPVMLVFCQLLVDRRKADSEDFVGETMTQPIVPCDSESYERIKPHCVSKTAFNRWLVAYTLLKNPDLRRMRKRTQRLSFLTM